AAELGIGRPRRAAGRAGDDDGAGLQRHVGGEEMDQMRAGEDHVGGGGRLAQLAVDARAQAQLLRIADLVGGYDPRTGGTRGLEALAAAELVPGEALVVPSHLAVARGDVVDDGVAEDVLEGALDRDVAPGLA